ncbi:MAG: hypothetical protein QXK37_03200 [Candidatus Woesearchaeota archaeon]
MLEALHEAKEELKRVDHLIYVSLKYTRTVDVLRNVLNRLISSLDFALLSLLRKAIEERKIEEIPEAFKLKCEEIKKIYKKDDIILEGVEFYLLLKKMEKADYTKEMEYRRHVAMVSRIDDKDIKVDIDTVTEYYKKVKALIEHIESIMK